MATDIIEKLSKDLDEKTKSILQIDEWRKTGTKITDHNDDVWTLKKTKYLKVAGEEKDADKHRFGTWKKKRFINIINIGSCKEVFLLLYRNHSIMWEEKKKMTF